jgi:hypothetical protein
VQRGSTWVVHTVGGILEVPPRVRQCEIKIEIIMRQVEVAIVVSFQSCDNGDDHPTFRLAGRVTASSAVARIHSESERPCFLAASANAASSSGSQLTVA